jgi:hypothetical protein
MSKTKQEMLEMMVDSLSNDEIHDLICHVTKRFVILNWYTKEDIELITGSELTDKNWNKLLCTQGEIAEGCNSMVKEWKKQSDLNEMTSIKIHNTLKFNPEQNNEDGDEMEVMLLTLTNKQLQKYAGISNNSYSKEELVEIIMKQLKENANKIKNKKLERLNKMLSS